jgi:hypothetical protein
MADTVDDFWQVLIPKEYPYSGDLLKRVPVPGFFQSPSHSIAVESAGSVSGLVKSTGLTKSALRSRWKEVSSMGVMADADWTSHPSERFQRLKEDLRGIGLPISASAPGEISGGPPRMGIYVFPDNRRQGTLEDLLDECAGQVYPSLLTSARRFVGGVDRAVLTAEDVEEVAKPSGEIKATLGCMASFLRPTKTLQVSVTDNRWLCDETLALDNIRSVHSFLVELLGLDA